MMKSVRNKYSECKKNVLTVSKVVEYFIYSFASFCTGDEMLRTDLFDE
jgi:hypothetical protein